MNAWKKIVSVILCLAMLCAMGCTALGETAPDCNTFAFGCFAYRIPFLTGVQQQEGNTVCSTMMGNYTVTARHLAAPVADTDAASAAVQEHLGLEMTLTEGENGVFTAMQQGDYSYYLVLAKDTTLLCIAATNPHYLSLLREQYVLLPEPVSAEAPVPAPEANIPAYLPYEYALNSMGVTIENAKTAMSAMLTQGELGVTWDIPVVMDETYACVTANLQALGCCVSFVYEIETSEVVSVQWYKFLYAGTGNGDLYTETVNSGQTGAAVFTALLFAKCGLDMNAFGARVPELQSAFTELQSWLDAVSTEALNLDDVFDSSTLLIDTLLAVHIESDIVSEVGNVVQACLTSMY